MVLDNRKVVLSLEVAQLHSMTEFNCQSVHQIIFNFSWASLQSHQLLYTSGCKPLKPSLSYCQTGEPCSSRFLLVISFDGIKTHKVLI